MYVQMSISSVNSLRNRTTCTQKNIPLLRPSSHKVPSLDPSNTLNLPKRRVDGEGLTWTCFRRVRQKRKFHFTIPYGHL